MTWSIQTKIKLGFGIALGLLLLIDIVAFVSMNRLMRTVESQMHAYEVLEDLDELLSLLQDAETGQRGFLLTGDENYLEPYYSAAPATEADFEELRRLTADNPAHQQRLDRLQPLVQRKLAELRTTIETRRAEGFDAAMAMVRSNEGKQVMDAIRNSVAELKQVEHALLVQREQAAAASARSSMLIVFVGSLLGVAVLLVALSIIRRDEQVLRSAYGDLEVRVSERTRELAAANEHLRAEIEQRNLAEARLEQATQQLEKSRDDLVSILDRLDLPIAMTDRDGRVTFMSHAAIERFGSADGDQLGRPWQEVFPLDEPQRHRVARLIAQERGRERARVPGRIDLAGGQHYWVELEVQDHPDAQRKVLYFHNLTEVYDLRSLADAPARFHGLVGNAEVIRRVFQQIRELGQVDSTVLIEGETGTGKELTARAIHEQSNRRDQPFIAVNVAGLTESLLASQLFGHRRGSFTGAVADHAGLFEAANGGTIFLDEIGDVPLELQSTLLRVLQEREVTRVGETRARRVDVRFLAATQDDLNAAIEEGRFRADLLYRIRVGRVQLPPLRQRREDISLLTAWFLKQRSAATGKVVTDISHEAMVILLDYDWPGNVRELKSAIELACIHCTSAIIQPADLPPEILGRQAARGLPLLDGSNESDRLRSALARSRGNRSKAARLLGISRATLYRRLTTLGIKAD